MVEFDCGVSVDSAGVRGKCTDKAMHLHGDSGRPERPALQKIRRGWLFAEAEEVEEDIEGGQGEQGASGVE